MAEYIPGADLRMLKESGHWLYEERWDEVREIVLRSLSQVDEEN